jgi:hypothetical protein
MRIKEKDILKTAFMTHYGYYKVLVMPFVFTNAPTIFMDLMKRVFWSYLDKFIVVFINHILIYSNFYSEHEHHLRRVLQTFKNQELYAKLNKCKFWLKEVVFLGHFISGEGISMNPRKVEAVLK